MTHTINTLNILDLPNEMITFISRYLVSEKPQDLLRFGQTCKTIHSIVHSEIFVKYIQFCKEEVPLTRRFNMLTGEDNAEGLIEEAYTALQAAERKLEIENQIYDDIHATSTFFTDEEIKQEEELKTKIETQVTMLFQNFMDLNSELETLMSFDLDLRPLGKIPLCKTNITHEIRIIRHYLLTDEASNSRKRKLLEESDL